eukprot:7231607-Pyramimonas_sp.AAC.1
MESSHWSPANEGSPLSPPPCREWPSWRDLSLLLGRPPFNSLIPPLLLSSPVRSPRRSVCVFFHSPTQLPSPPQRERAGSKMDSSQWLPVK